MTDYEFVLRSECQVDLSSKVATWIFHNIKPTLATTDMLRRAVSALNDEAYPTLERFGLAGYISAQWMRKTDSTLADEVLSHLWRWDQKYLTRSEAAEILRQRAQHRDTQPAWLRRVLKRIEKR